MTVLTPPRVHPFAVAGESRLFQEWPKTHRAGKRLFVMCPRETVQVRFEEVCLDFPNLEIVDLEPHKFSPPESTAKQCRQDGTVTLIA
jgi:hypothetical protein